MLTFISQQVYLRPSSRGIQNQVPRPYNLSLLGYVPRSCYDYRCRGRELSACINSARFPIIYLWFTSLFSCFAVRDAPWAPAVAGEYSLLRGSAGFPIRLDLGDISLFLMHFGNYSINRQGCIRFIIVLELFSYQMLYSFYRMINHHPRTRPSHHRPHLLSHVRFIAMDREFQDNLYIPLTSYHSLRTLGIHK